MVSRSVVVKDQVSNVKGISSKAGQNGNVWKVVGASDGRRTSLTKDGSRPA